MQVFFVNDHQTIEWGALKFDRPGPYRPQKWWHFQQIIVLRSSRVDGIFCYKKYTIVCSGNQQTAVFKGDRPEIPALSKSIYPFWVKKRLLGIVGVIITIL